MYAKDKDVADKTDRKMYEKEFFNLIEADFEQERYQINQALIGNAKELVNNRSDSRSGTENANNRGQIGVNSTTRTAGDPDDNGA